MEATIKDPTKVRSAIAIIEKLAPDCKITFYKQQLRISSADTAMVAHIVYEYNACTADEEFDANVKLKHLYQALGKATVESEVKLSIYKGGLLVLEYDKPRRVRHEIPMLNDTDLVKSGEPNPKGFNAKAVASMASFREAIEEAGDVGTEFSLYSKNNSLYIKAEAEVGGRNCTVEVEGNAYEGDDEQLAKYSYEFIEPILATSKIYASVVIEYGTDYPLLLKFNDELSYMRFLLGPRVKTV